MSEQSYAAQKGMTETDVHIQNVSKIFNEGEDEEVKAVDDLDIEVKEGEFLVLVGPSGCGKSTTLRSIAGLEEPTHGQIVISGRDVTGLDPRERDVAMVFQNYALYPSKTVRGNMEFPLRIRRYDEDQIGERIERTADILDITDLLDRKPKELSGGQQQRVALGRAIIRDPEVFLMDEPLSNLDAKLRTKMRTELNQIHKQLEVTTVYVTHDQAEAMTLGDRIAVMNNGQLQQIDPPQQLYDHPVNQFVAGFIGEPSMNFLSAEVNEVDGARKIQTNFFEFKLPTYLANTECDLKQQRSLDFGIRPEDIYDATRSANYRAGETAETHEFTAQVNVVEPLGSDVYLTLRPDDGTEELRARVAPESDIQEGDQVDLYLDLKNIHLFDDNGIAVRES